MAKMTKLIEFSLDKSICKYLKASKNDTIASNGIKIGVAYSHYPGYFDRNTRNLVFGDGKVVLRKDDVEDDLPEIKEALLELESASIKAGERKKIYETMNDLNRIELKAVKKYVNVLVDRNSRSLSSSL